MIGISLPPGVLTDNPIQPADKCLLDACGGSAGVLQTFKEQGVGAVEIRSLRPDTPGEVTRACARAVAQANLRLTIHATLADMPAVDFFTYLMPALEIGLRDDALMPLTVHMLRSGSETLDAANTARTLNALADYIDQKGLRVVIALENNRIHGPGLSIVQCDGVYSVVREVGRPAVGTCFDFGHLYSNFLTYPAWTQFLPPEGFLSRAVQTHIHGVTEITHWPLTGDNLPLEDYLRCLKAAGYRGIYNLELESGRFWRSIDPRAGFEMSIRRLRAALDQMEDQNHENSTQGA